MTHDVSPTSDTMKRMLATTNVGGTTSVSTTSFSNGDYFRPFYEALHSFNVVGDSLRVITVGEPVLFTGAEISLGSLSVSLSTLQIAYSGKNYSFVEFLFALSGNSKYPQFYVQSGTGSTSAVPGLSNTNIAFLSPASGTNLNYRRGDALSLSYYTNPNPVPILTVKFVEEFQFLKFWTDHL